MKLKFEESIMTTIIILINVLVFGVPNSNPVKSFIGLLVLWVIGYVILSYDLNTGDDHNES